MDRQPALAGIHKDRLPAITPRISVKLNLGDAATYRDPASSMPGNDKINILVVDDLPEKLLVFETILAELNENVISVRSGEEALRQVLERDFAVILLDVNMPGMDGLETAEFIRKRRRSALTPIIFITAYADDVHANRGYSLGAVDYILTPVVPDVLRTKVRVFVDLYRMHDQMRRQAEQRIALAHEQAARAAAEDASRRKDEFLAMLAHELRNPLSPISNAVELLQMRGPQQPELVWARNIIERQVKHLARLVDDLLDVSRITRGKIALRKKRVTVAEIVAIAEETSRPIIDARGHTLHLSLPPIPVILEADPDRLCQILGNLLNNAAKYTEPGGQIWLAVESIRDEAVFRVRDNGVGIPPELLPRVFDMFTQVDRSLDRSQGGLGIGLTLVHRLVELHGGTVRAASAGEGSGSEFVVRLPLPAQSDVPVAPAGRAGSLSRSPRRRVLVVDDQADVAECLALLLKEMGHDVATAHDGVAACEVVRTFDPDIVLLDLGLPQMDGYEVARRLRSEHGRGRMRLVALSGYGQDDDRRRTREAGFDDHLLKPAGSQELQRLLGYSAAGP